MWRYLALRKIGLVFAEGLLLAFCVVIAYGIRLHTLPLSSEEPNILPKAILIAAIFQLFLHLNDIYDFRRSSSTREYVVRLLQALFMASVALSALYFLLPDMMVGRGVFLISLILSCIFIIIWHTLLRIYWDKRTPHTNLLILGTSTIALEAVKEILRRPELGIRIVGFVDEDPKLIGTSIVNPSVIGVYEDLPRLMAEHEVNRVVIAMQDRRGKLPIRDLLDFKTRGVAIEDVATLYERVAGKIPVENLKPSWMVFNTGFTVSRRLLMEKRIFSLVGSTILLILLSPIMLLLMLLIKLDSKGPIFYLQERVGQGGKTFKLIKFRSMREDAEAQTGPVWSNGDSDERVTRLGRIMRRTRLDELPQLFNVFRGDMSLVGPRPERPHFVKTLTESIPYYNLRHMIKPGITGWAQINYGYANSLEHTVEKLQYDLFYIKNMSWILDMLIVLQTIKTALTEKGS